MGRACWGLGSPWRWIWPRFRLGRAWLGLARRRLAPGLLRRMAWLWLGLASRARAWLGSGGDLSQLTGATTRAIIVAIIPPITAAAAGETENAPGSEVFAAGGNRFTGAKVCFETGELLRAVSSKNEIGDLIGSARR